jgi:hypothetical protein
MLKPVIAATVVLAIAGGSAVYAQHDFGARRGPWARWHAHGGHHLSAADMAAFTDARIAALKAGLELTPGQAKNWPAFEQALRAAAQLRITRIEAWQAQRQNADSPHQGERAANPFDRLERRADNLSATGAALKKVADAGAPLYQSLTDAQKARFRMLARILRPHPRRFAFLERRGGWRRDGRDFGPPAGPRPQHHFAPGGDSGHALGSQL